jgi:hypothetical protein
MDACALSAAEIPIRQYERHVATKVNRMIHPLPLKRRVRVVVKHRDDLMGKKSDLSAIGNRLR